MKSRATAVSAICLLLLLLNLMLLTTRTSHGGVGQGGVAVTKAVPYVARLTDHARAGVSAGGPLPIVDNATVTVPAGQRFVIQHVNAYILTSGTDKPVFFRVSSRTDHKEFLYNYLAAPSPSNPIDNMGHNIFIANEPALMYADPGTPITLFAEHLASSSTDAAFEVTLTGHLESAQ